MVCGTTNPSSSSEPTASRCRPPSVAARTKSWRSRAAPAIASALAIPAVPCEKFGALGTRPARIPQSRPAPVGSAARSRDSPPVVAIVSALSPPAQIAASTMPAVPRTRSDVRRTGWCRTWCSTLPGSSDRRAAATRSTHCPGRAASAPARRRPARHTARVPCGCSPGRTGGPRSRAASACSASLRARYCPISASTGARPPIPAYTESRSSAGDVRRPSSDTSSGSHGPSSSRTWLRTHDQAASPSSRYASLSTT